MYTAVSNILRTVPEENAFNFYRAVDSPLGVKAANIEEFLDQLKKIEPASIEFHMGRHDFEKWIGMLGDATLVKQISSLGKREMPADEMKEQIIRLVRMRVGRLKKLSK